MKEVEFHTKAFNVSTDKEITLQGKELDGEWSAPPAAQVLPVKEEDYLFNIRQSCRLDLPNITYQREHDVTMVMVCGGVSAKDFLSDIRKKSKDKNYHVFSSNKTHDWLIENDIVPHTQFIVDPKKNKVKDVQNPHKDVRYLISISCVPEVFEKLKGYDVHRLFGISGVSFEGIKDYQIIKAFFASKDYTLLEGGTMAGLRAMTLANILGYKKVEFYGFDSCFYEKDDKGSPIYYAYDKGRAEDIMEAETDSGRVFQTTPVFASQARQFIKWKHRLAWIDFKIYGDSLTAEIHRIDEEKHKLKGILISEYMLELNKAMHASVKNYGNGVNGDVGMSAHAGRMAVLAGQVMKNHGDITMLDYGCGKKAFEARMPPVKGLTVKSYDPCIEGFDDAPTPADIVVCVDVLEHVELDYVDDVLADLERLTKKLCYISVHTKEATKYYSDGQNMHLIQANYEWWYPKLRKLFDIVEENTVKNHFNCVLQKKGLNGSG